MFINISYKYKSKNYDLRKKKISFIIIHYTETKTLEEAIKILTSKKSKVSSHFVIDRNGDIYNLVKIKFRANVPTIYIPTNCKGPARIPPPLFSGILKISKLI